jgi:hypothetical protein
MTIFLAVCPQWDRDRSLVAACRTALSTRILSPDLASRVPVKVFLLFTALIAAAPVCGQEETPFTRLFDTGVASAEPLAADAVAPRTGWRLVPEDTVDHRFSGDAVLLNDKLTVVLRKQGRGAEVYSKAASGLQHRATLGHAGTRSPVIEPFQTLKILENGSGAVLVEGAFGAAESAALRFRLTTGEAILEIHSAGAAQSVAALTKARYLIVPDYFGDDMVYSTLSPSDGERVLYLPAENFCLNLLDGGDAIMMSVWQSSEQEVWLTTTNSATADNVCSSTIQCLEGKSIWLAFLEFPGIWHSGSVSAQADWKPVFPAKWRCSLVRENGVADSWDLEQGPQSDQTAGPHDGPLVVYPIDRNTATPLTVSCPTDVMRNTLGVGPCQYILACEGLTSQGDPTPNSVMVWVEKQFEQKKEKKAAEDIKDRLKQMTRHVAEARVRIERYAQSADQIRKWLASQPGPASFRSILGDLDRSVAAGLATNASPARANQLATAISALVGQNNGLTSCRRLGEELRSIGAVQDSTLAKCRMAVRRLRAEGRTMAANQPQEAAWARELQRLAEQILQRK